MNSDEKFKNYLTDLTKSKVNGPICGVTGFIHENYFNDGILFIEDKLVYIFQNRREGNCPNLTIPQKFSFKYSYTLGNNCYILGLYVTNLKISSIIF